MPPKKASKRDGAAALEACCLPPAPFCEVEAPGGAALAGPAALAQCLICCVEKPRFAAVGRCGHAEVCWLCAVRLRALLRQFHCPVCKEDLPHVSVTDTPTRPPVVGPKNSSLYDEKLGIIYARAEIKEEVERLFDYSCWQSGCNRTFNTLPALERHLRDEHARQFCPTCLRDRKVFLFEQTIYAPADLERHRREGDVPQLAGRCLPPTPPHVQCNFCKRCFYAQDDLVGHMHKRHHHCALCARQGRRGDFYRDFGCLSQHYEEQHYVCMHEDCRREGYRLVAFNSEDDLRMHEVAEHTLAAEKSVQRSKRRVRLNLQIGSTSYRDERRLPPDLTGEDRPMGYDDDLRVRFMWPKSDLWGAAARRDASNASREAEEDDEEGQRYPPRHARTRAGQDMSSFPGQAAPARQSVAEVPPPSPSSATSSRPNSSWRRHGAEPQPQEEPPPRGSVTAIPIATTASGQLLAAALAHVQRQGLDSAQELETEAYRERNRSFRVELQDALGAERLAEFRQHSASFRQATSEAADEPAAVGAAVAGYAERVLDVFAEAEPSLGLAAASRLLGDLVVLLPDQQLRHALHRQLGSLQARETKGQRCGGSSSQNVRRPEPAAQNLRRPEPAAREPAGPAVALPAALESLPAARAYGPGSERQPSFTLALGAVLAALSQEESPQLTRQCRVSLERQIARLQNHQRESLELMQQQLVQACASRLDFSCLERVLALRPQLLLKLQAQSSASWREWKVAAAAVLKALGPEERLCVRGYIEICNLHRPSALPAEDPAAVAFPTVQAVSRPPGRQMPQSQDVAGAPGTCRGFEGEPPASQGRRKGKQRPVLAAWG